MIYNEVLNEKLSRLGFGCMRLPVLEDGSIDQKQVDQMVDYAIENGVNYFDTAYPYHESKSEISIGQSLKRYPRESFFLATKYPGHQLFEQQNPEGIFEEQLKKCQVDYFDFYLLHNINEGNIKYYMDPKYGILEYFLKQKELGRIKHLGFSCHAYSDNLEKFLKYADGRLEFCQIQFNYLDYSLQDAKNKYEIISKYGLPVWVMEPIRGGKLANLSEEDTEKLKELRPDESIASWALRYVSSFENCKVILSGMSSYEQMVDNVKTFSFDNPLSEEEINILYEVAENLKDTVPCTKCRYCCEGCPMGLDIPLLIDMYNNMKLGGGLMVSQQLSSFPNEKLPNACLQCFQCNGACPQHIDIVKTLEEFSILIDKSPKWIDICKARNEAAKKI